MNYVQPSYTELNDRYQLRIFDRISASALGRREPVKHDAAHSMKGSEPRISAIGHGKDGPGLTFTRRSECAVTSSIG